MPERFNYSKHTPGTRVRSLLPDTLPAIRTLAHAPRIKVSETSTTEQAPDPFDVPYDVLDLSIHTYGALRSLSRAKLSKQTDRYLTIREIDAISNDDILDLWNVGKKTLKDIREKVTEYKRAHGIADNNAASQEQKPDPFDVPFDALELTPRLFNAVRRASWQITGNREDFYPTVRLLTVREIDSMSDEALFGKEVGKGMRRRIREKVTEYKRAHGIVDELISQDSNESQEVSPHNQSLNNLL